MSNKDKLQKNIQSQWKELPGKKIFTVKSGLGFKAEEYVASGVPLLQIENVGYGKIKWNGVIYLPSNYVNKYPELLLKKRDIVLALNRPVTNDRLKISRLTKNDEPSILYQRVGKLIPYDEVILNDYLYQMSQLLIKRFVLEQSIGSDQPYIAMTDLYRYKFLIPPVSEQKRIVAVLEMWDEMIEKLEKKIELKKNIKKGLMQQLLTGKTRLASFSGKWIKKSLSEICEIDPKAGNLPEKFNYIDLGSVEKGKLIKVDTIEISNAPSRAQRSLKNQDVIFQTVRPYQMNNLFFERAGNYVASTGYAQLRTDNNPKFLYYLLHEDSFIKSVLRRCTGSNYPAINSSDLSEISVNIPANSEEKNEISDILTSADKEIDSLEEKLAKIKDQKKYLLNNLVTGSIRVPM